MGKAIKKHIFGDYDRTPPMLCLLRDIVAEIIALGGWYLHIMHKYVKKSVLCVFDLKSICFVKHSSDEN